MKSADVDRAFPVTLLELSRETELLESLVEEFCTHFKHNSWFPSFLREQGLSPRVYQCADLEWNLLILAENRQHKIRGTPQDKVNNLSTDFNTEEKTVGQFYRVNPQAKFCPVDFDFPQFHLTAGLYVFVEDQVLKLNSEQASLLDLMAEGMCQYPSNALQALNLLLDFGVILSRPSSES